MNRKTYNIPQVQNGMCQVCGTRPKYIEQSGFQHPYCGRTCARRGQSNNNCRLRGCSEQGSATFVGFCTESHAKQAVRFQQVKGCTGCNILPVSTRNLCVGCDRRIGAEPRLEELQVNGSPFNMVRDEIDRSWRSAASDIKVEKIFRVVNSQAKHALINYRQKLASSSSVEQLRTFHSSQCMCNLGHLGSEFCTLPSCGICTAVQSSFNSLAFGAKHNTGRHGKGIYSYLNPAQADQHSTSCTSSPYRVVISCDVVVEKAEKSRYLPAVHTPSVIDEDRVFVSNPDAIIARHIILYRK